MDITGQVCSDSIGTYFYSGIGGQVDFLRGASRSKGGKPIIALSSLVSADAIERGKRVGLHDYVAKFDRQGLIAALKEQTAAVGCAA